MKVLIAVPCMDMVSTSFMTSLVGLDSLPDAEVEMCAVQSSLVYDARNDLGQRAIAGGYDRVLWLDSDMVFPGNIITRLNKRLDEGLDFVSGLYFTRKEPIMPTLYKDVRMEEAPEHGKKTAVLEPYPDYPRDSLFEIASCGFGCVMMKTEIISEIFKNFGLPFSPVLGFGEDISFCLRASKLGYKLWCDSSIKLGHVGYTVITESIYDGERKVGWLAK